MLFTTSLGVEISGKDLRLAVLRSAAGKLRFVQSLDIPGFVDLVPEEQGKAISNLIGTYKLRSRRVYLSLPRDHGIVRQLEFPIEVRDKLKSAVALQLETLCPWPVDEIYWDFSGETPKKGAKVIRATVVMIPRSALDPWIEFFRAVKLPLSGASLSAVSSAHGVSCLWNDNLPTLLLDCEAGYVEGSLVQGSRLTSVTESGLEVRDAAKTAIDRLCAVGRVAAPETARVIVYGATAGSLEATERVALPIENARVENTDRFGAIAAALIGLKKSPFDSNLVPTALRYRQNQLQLIPTYALIVLAVLLGVAMAAREPYQTMVYASKLDTEIKKIAPDIKEVTAQETELNKLSEKYRALVADIQARDYNLEAIRELSRALPSTAWLTSYSYQDGTITISGFAASGSEVQKTVEDTALFKDVQFTTSLTRDTSGKDRFTLKATVEVPR